MHTAIEPAGGQGTPTPLGRVDVSFQNWLATEPGRQLLEICTVHGIPRGMAMKVLHATFIAGCTDGVSFAILAYTGKKV
jgi:hypothetical protein